MVVPFFTLFILEKCGHKFQCFIYINCHLSTNILHIISREKCISTFNSPPKLWGSNKHPYCTGNDTETQWQLKTCKIQALGLQNHFHSFVLNWLWSLPFVKISYCN
jgi:hypothetical protein